MTDGGVYVVDVATGETTRVAEGDAWPEGVDAWPEWVDDDTLLLPISD